METVTLLPVLSSGIRIVERSSSLVGCGEKDGTCIWREICLIACGEKDGLGSGKNVLFVS